MKKKVILLFLAISCMPNLYSQFGIRIGYNAANEVWRMPNPDFGTGFGISSGTLPGIQFGILKQWQITTNGLYAETGLLYSRKGVHFDYTFSRTDVHVPEYVKKSEYLELPVNLKYKYDINPHCGVFIQSGGFVAGLLNRKYALVKNKSFSDDWSRYAENETKIDLKKRFDYGLSVGAGVEIYKHFQITAAYSWGLNETTTAWYSRYKTDFSEYPHDIRENGFITTSYNRVFSISLTYLLK